MPAGRARRTAKILAYLPILGTIIVVGGESVLFGSAPAGAWSDKTDRQPKLA
jgi:hypothetical protein